MAIGATAAVRPSPVVAAEPCANSGVPGTPYEGFGAATTGGAGKPIYRVTTLADSGPGSLREAVSSSNRCIVFDVAGDIVLTRQIYVGGAFVTIDGFTAPAPGITLRDYGISIWGAHGAHEVVLRGLRFRNAGQKTCAQGECWDGIQIKNGAYRVVVDHVSSDRASDGALDIGSQSEPLTRDVTVQWSILSGTRNQSLVHRATRISMHHNLFINGHNRNPQVTWDHALATAPPDLTLDFRNNLVWNFSAYGTLVRSKATANVAANYYYSPVRTTAGQALVVDAEGRAHVRGNHSGNDANVNALGTERSEFAAPPVSTTDACQAGYAVRAGAGARAAAFGLDALDSESLAGIPAALLPGCPAAPPSAPVAQASPPSPAAPTVSITPSSPDLVLTALSIPSTVYSGEKFSVKFGVTNRGTAATSGCRLKIYLSADGSGSARVLLRDRYIAALAAGASQWHSLSEVVPAEIKPGTYRVLLMSAQDGTATPRPMAAVDITVSRPAQTPDLVLTSVALPATLRRGAKFPVRFGVANRGAGASQDSRVKIYLSADTRLSTGDVLLRSRYVSRLAPGAAESHALSEIIPAGVKPGSYKVLLVLDQDQTVTESNEGNNVTIVSVRVY
jgi:hypothetical protein